MKKIVNALILSIFFSSGLGFAQTSIIPDFKYSGQEFSDGINKFISKHNSVGLYISNYLSHNFNDLHILCHEGVALVRFKFDNSGNIMDVGCSKTAPTELSNALKFAIKASEKYWSINKSNGQDKWYIQPITYKYGINCNELRFDSYSLSGGIFEFDDNSKLEILEYIILEPITTNSGADEKTIVPIPKN